MWPSARPPIAERGFRSRAVEAEIIRVQRNLRDPELAWTFANCYPNTLDTTVRFEIRDGLPDTFIITGDIDAMWLRDSSAQVQPYLRLCQEDPDLALMIAGLIRRQTRCILLDPYANAFYREPGRESPWKNDETKMKPGVHERKWELNSLSYCLRLAYQYWMITGDSAPFDSDWQAAMRHTVELMVEQQRKRGKGAYSFRRPTDVAAGDDHGNPWRATGMICSAFRASDDAALYLFNIPENLFALTSLRQLAELLEALDVELDLASKCRDLAVEIEAAVKTHGIIDHPRWGEIYAYECDGLGKVNLMDDANIPSLLAIPYLGYKDASDPVYVNTRRFVLSEDNPYFYRCDGIEGIGSPHTEELGDYIWPMSIIARGLTSQEDEEAGECCRMLKQTHAGTGLMHEAFQKDNPARFTRPWFAWPNSLFGELILKFEAIPDGGTV